jgi:hypothetical protein
MTKKSDRQLLHEVDAALARGKSSKHRSSVTPVILMREGNMRGKGAPDWRQYLVITDGRVAIVEMTPALLGGWSFKRVTVQGNDDWPNMTRDQIVASKRQWDDGKTTEPKIDPEFRQKLLARAGID